MTTVEISCSRRPSSIACQRWARRMPPHLRMRINCNRLATTLADDAALNHTSWPLSLSLLMWSVRLYVRVGRLEVPFCNRTGLGRARAVAAGIQHHKPKLLHSLLLNLSFGLSWSVMFPIVPLHLFWTPNSRAKEEALACSTWPPLMRDQFLLSILHLKGKQRRPRSRKFAA